jgi:anti-sigma factor RsiW
VSPTKKNKEWGRQRAAVAAAFREELDAAAPTAANQEKQSWPKTMPEQARVVRQALAARTSIVTPQQLARAFARARVERIEELLQTLVSLGQARQVGDGHYTS